MYRALCTAALLAALTACSPGLPSADAALTTAVESGETESESESEAGDTAGSEDGETGTATETGDPPTDLPPEFVACDPHDPVCPVGQKCAPFASDGETYDGNKCVPVLGDTPAGEPCSSDGPLEATDDCDQSSVCWHLQQQGDDELHGLCVTMCTTLADEPECVPGEACVELPSTPLCLLECDALLQDCLGPDGVELGCYFHGEGFYCRAAGTLALDEPCEAPGDCAPGYLCWSGELLPGCGAPTCCAATCDPFDPQCPAAQTECVELLADMWGLADVGVCQLR